MSNGQYARVNADVTVERFDAREWSEEQLDALFAEGCPRFILADQDAERMIGSVRDSFPNLHALVKDGEYPVAAGWGVPIRWSGDVSSLPSGYTDSLRRALDLRAQDGQPDTLVICAGVVHPEHKGSGIATSLIRALIDLAGRGGLSKVIAPLRPTLKHRTRSQTSANTPHGPARMGCRSTVAQTFTCEWALRSSRWLPSLRP